MRSDYWSWGIGSQEPHGSPSLNKGGKVCRQRGRNNLKWTGMIRRVLTTVLKGEQWMIQRKRFRNCNIQTSTLEKEAKLPASYQGPNRQNCLLLNDDKLTEPLYSRSSDYVRLKFFQLKFDRNQMIHSFHVRMLFIRPRLNILIFLPFSGWKYSYGSWRFCSFLLCYIYGTNPVSLSCTVHQTVISIEHLIMASAEFFQFFFSTFAGWRKE